MKLPELPELPEMIARVPEPELMDSEEQAAAYADADFSESNQRFVDRLLADLDDGERGDRPGADVSVVDLGCGPADIPIRLARATAAARITAVDGAAAMIDRARQAVRRAGLAGRIRLVCAALPGALPGEQFDVVISNSTLHHLADPELLWSEIRRLGRPGAGVLVADLRRPPTRQAARALVDQYAAGEAEILRRDFENSLLAAYAPEEIRAQLATAGLDGALSVEPIGDRHVAISGRLPEM